MDYKDSRTNHLVAEIIFTRTNYLLIMGLSLGMLIALMCIKPLSYSIDMSIDLPLPQNNTQLHLTSTPIPIKTWQTVTVQPHDTLIKIFKDYDLSLKDLHLILQQKDAKQALTHIQPYQQIELSIKDHQLITLRYALPNHKILTMQREGNTFKLTQSHKSLEVHSHYKIATITHSLLADGVRAGIPKNIIFQVANMFSSEIDFARDIHYGDSFIILYNDYYNGDHKIHNGDILAAEFINKKHVYRAIRFVDPKGKTHFYNPEGKSLEHAFLRAPLKYKRISDTFNMRRFHPILHVYRPHQGVDYAAPSGTPIHAVADGLITYHKRKGGYGYTIIIKHNSKYSTLYAHLSRYSKHIKKGSYVKRGQTIGFVGKTGLATGPHLHYEFHIHGKPHDPLTVKLPRAGSIQRRYREKFITHAKDLIAQLDLYKSAMLATT